MATTPQEQKSVIALISMPWAIFNRPSIQLGALKGYVEETTECKVTALHPYLDIAKEIGTGNYNTIADSSWAGEALFSALLFVDRQEQAKRVFTEGLSDSAKRLPKFDVLLEKLEAACTAWLARIEWDSFLLAGFSLCFNQLFSSLYMASRLKERPDCPPLLFGGSSCAGDLGRSLLDHFPQIDYIIDGEGETPLAALCEYLAGRTDTFPDRVLALNSPGPVAPTPEIPDLNTLPAPDYTDYFSQLHTIFPDLPFIPVLPVEFSRGCWWDKCTFCNLNLQWGCYRWKDGRKVAAEIEQFTLSYRSLDYTFTDNALPPREADVFFDMMKDSSADFRFFAEIRAITRMETLHRYSQGGLKTIQVGIEALSASLLTKMKKGVSVLENIAIMKYAMAAGITLEGNIIIEFPGSTPDEVSETIENLEYVLPFRPLSAASFFVGHGSPIEHSPANHGIKAVIMHAQHRRLLPEKYRKNLRLLIRQYRGDRQYQRKLWQSVRQRLKAWQDFHNRRSANTPSALSYRDGGTFLIIRQEVPGSATLHHRLQGMSRAIYLFCDTVRTLPEILERFPNLKESAVLSFVHQLCRKRLMFRDRDAVLSLAIHRG